jgi:hypothetical protein
MSFDRKFFSINGNLTEIFFDKWSLDRVVILPKSHLTENVYLVEKRSFDQMCFSTMRHLTENVFRQKAIFEYTNIYTYYQNYTKSEENLIIQMSSSPPGVMQDKLCSKRVLNKLMF